MKLMKQNDVDFVILIGVSQPWLSALGANMRCKNHSSGVMYRVSVGAVMRGEDACASQETF